MPRFGVWFCMLGFHYRQYQPPVRGPQDRFDHLLNVFSQLLQYTNGDADEAIAWMLQLNRKHPLFDEEYSMDDFLRDLKSNGYLADKQERGSRLTSRMERYIRTQAFEDIFSGLKRSESGHHRTPYTGRGDESLTETRPFQFGDSTDMLDVTRTIYNAHINHGIDDFRLQERDLEVYDTQFYTAQATVIMIDLSHSMILYGEDRITPAKKVAMGLSELIMTRYPSDSLSIIAFGDTAWEVSVKDLPYLAVGPYHTNTKEGLQLARHLLRRKATDNKQIFMITDGKPSCIREGNRLYKNSMGLDPKILNRTLDEAEICRREGISITTFMIARDPILQDFVRQLTTINQGRAYFSSLNKLGEFIFEDYILNRKKTVR